MPFQFSSMAASLSELTRHWNKTLAREGLKVDRAKGLPRKHPPKGNGRAYREYVSHPMAQNMMTFREFKRQRAKPKEIRQ